MKGAMLQLPALSKPGPLDPFIEYFPISPCHSEFMAPRLFSDPMHYTTERRLQRAEIRINGTFDQVPVVRVVCPYEISIIEPRLCS